MLTAPGCRRGRASCCCCWNGCWHKLGGSPWAVSELEKEVKHGISMWSLLKHTERGPRTRSCFSGCNVADGWALLQFCLLYSARIVLSSSLTAPHQAGTWHWYPAWRPSCAEHLRAGQDGERERSSSPPALILLERCLTGLFLQTRSEFFMLFPFLLVVIYFKPDGLSW